MKLFAKKEEKDKKNWLYVDSLILFSVSILYNCAIKLVFGVGNDKVISWYKSSE